jgi:hypothetical protein
MNTLEGGNFNLLEVHLNQVYHSGNDDFKLALGESPELTNTLDLLVKANIPVLGVAIIASFVDDAENVTPREFKPWIVETAGAGLISVHTARSLLTKDGINNIICTGGYFGSCLSTAVRRLLEIVPDEEDWGKINIHMIKELTARGVKDQMGNSDDRLTNWYRSQVFPAIPQVFLNGIEQSGFRDYPQRKHKTKYNLSIWEDINQFKKQML